ncbi:uncharacterized protein LOC141648168 [Silene latifolia]|uniref:uncharacterized protein LOC141648168 n=1 Tax=Silene latifolia TaxID=37657 RepID=UPI003D789591
MHKQSPSRGHKSKGIKVKHVLQICVLLAVCFWLIYQVKHSQEKRREFDAKDEKVVDKAQMDGEILRFGRKDLPRVREIVAGGDKHGEDDDEKEDEEEESAKPEEEQNKHEEDEPEREDGSIHEREEERGGGDDETDEIELEKKEMEYEHGVEKVEEKERDDDEEDVDESHAENEEKELPGKEEHFEVEENEDAGKEDPNEKDLESNDRDHDGDNADTHGAREEQYKADDASSEVAQHVHNNIPRTENVTSGQANDMFGKSDSVQENETKSSENPDNLIKTKVEPREEVSSNVTSLVGKNPGLSDGVITASNANASQNVIVEGAPGDKDLTLLRNVSGDSNKPGMVKDENQASDALNKTENANTNGGESISSSNATMTSQIGNDTDATKPEKVNSAGNENRGVNLEENEAGGTDESSSSHINDENAGDIQHDPIDESDNVTEEERESRVDLETLPDIQNEGQNDEETMAE